MAHIPVAHKFLGFNSLEELRKCRELAAEAQSFASAALSPEFRATYLELKRQWNVLADDIEHVRTTGVYKPREHN